MQAVSQRTQDQKSFGKAASLEFESQGLTKQTLNLEFESSWQFIRNGMSMQEREVLESVMVQILKSKDDPYMAKSVKTTVAGISGTN